MRVAVLFTGALRTIRKTIRYFKSNLLLNPDVHVFACLQNDTQESNEQIELWLKSKLTIHLKSVQWFKNNEDNLLIPIRNNLVNTIPCPDNWKDYLKNSGSIIEYYQLYLAYLQMANYEGQHGKYDFIVRSRTDTIFTQPIDFHWLNWTDQDIQNRIKLVNEELILSNIPITANNTLQYFMNTIISDKLIHLIQNIRSKCYCSSTHVIPQTVSELNQYIKTGKYILTIRANNLYIVNRDYFQLIPTLGFIYGHLRSPYSDDYWFNSENQFQAACFHSGLTIFDYNTTYEDQSLYNYDEKKYFDLSFNILNPYMLYCVVRY